MVDLVGTGLNGLTTLVAAFGGFVLAGWNQRRGDERTADRERTRHLREVTTRLAEERHRDQLDLLRTVQEEVQELLRATFRIVNWDLTLVLEGADSSILPPGLNAEENDARVRLKMHVSRVLDEEVRLAVTHMAERCAEMTSPSFLSLGRRREAAEAEHGRRIGALNGIAEATLDLVGAAVRAEATWSPSAT